MINGRKYESSKRRKNSNIDRSLKRFFTSILDGSILTRRELVRQMPFIIFLTILALLYIGNQYHAEKVAIRISELKTDIKRLRSKSLSISSDLMYLSNQVEIKKLLHERGIKLEESTDPPQRIVVQPKKED